MSETTLRGAALAETLQATLRGPVLHPDEPGWEEARQVHNGMIQKHPALIARCANAADVITSLSFARAHGLDVSIRGGAHNAGGLGLVDDGLAIDLSSLRNVDVDPERGRRASAAARRSATSTTPRTPSGSACRPASRRRRASAA
jgi:hypothetical protein